MNFKIHICKIKLVGFAIIRIMYKMKLCVVFRIKFMHRIEYIPLLLAALTNLMGIPCTFYLQQKVFRCHSLNSIWKSNQIKCQFQHAFNKRIEFGCIIWWWIIANHLQNVSLFVLNSFFIYLFAFHCGCVLVFVFVHVRKKCKRKTM